MQYITELREKIFNNTLNDLYSGDKNYIKAPSNISYECLKGN